jgi:hypothetical protein
MRIAAEVYELLTAYGVVFCIFDLQQNPSERVEYDDSIAFLR